jgi:hypothetical protein
MTITCLEQLRPYGQNTSSIKQQAKRNRRKLGEFHEIPMESTLQNQEINADDEFISGTVCVPEVLFVSKTSSPKLSRSLPT